MSVFFYICRVLNDCRHDGIFAKERACDRTGNLLPEGNRRGEFLPLPWDWNVF
jgi:hypothetical protein